MIWKENQEKFQKISAYIDFMNEINGSVEQKD